MAMRIIQPLILLLLLHMITACNQTSENSKTSSFCSLYAKDYNDTSQDYSEEVLAVAPAEFKRRVKPIQSLLWSFSKADQRKAVELTDQMLLYIDNLCNSNYQADFRNSTKQTRCDIGHWDCIPATTAVPTTTTTPPEPPCEYGLWFSVNMTENCKTRNREAYNKFTAIWEIHTSAQEANCSLQGDHEIWRECTTASKANFCLDMLDWAKDSRQNGYSGNEPEIRLPEIMSIEYCRRACDIPEIAEEKGVSCEGTKH